MLSSILLNPLVVFVGLLVVVGLLALLAKLLETKGSPSAGKEEPYACGEDVPTGRIQPGYNDFFHFAFLFTILEVVALLIGTLVIGVSSGAIWLSMLILFVVVISLFVLFRRD